MTITSLSFWALIQKLLLNGFRVVITINVTEPQLEKCWTQCWWNSVETSRNNLSGESVSWWYATLQISVRDSQVPQPTLWSQVKSVGESDYVRDCHSKTYCQFNTGPVPAVVSSTKKFSLSLQRGFFELHQWSWSEMSGFIWVGQCALGLPGNQPTIRDPNSIPPSSTSSSNKSEFPVLAFICIFVHTCDICRINAFTHQLQCDPSFQL